MLIQASTRKLITNLEVEPVKAGRRRSRFFIILFYSSVLVIKNVGFFPGMAKKKKYMPDTHWEIFGFCRDKNL
jgi:hypothetical protein